MVLVGYAGGRRGFKGRAFLIALMAGKQFSALELGSLAEFT
jgi:hypothetical protein